MKSRLARPGPGSFREAPAQLVRVHIQFAASGSVATWKRRSGAVRQLSRGFRYNIRRRPAQLVGVQDPTWTGQGTEAPWRGAVPSILSH